MCKNRVEIKELLPGIIAQAGPQQYELLKKLQSEVKVPTAEKPAGEEKSEDIPELVATNFEEVSNKPQ